MVREYRSLYITNEMERARAAKREGRYVVLALPIIKPEETREPKDGEENIQRAGTVSGDGPEADFSEFPYALENIEEVSTDYLDRLILRFENKPWLIFETERCRVREITVADVDALYEIYADPRITMYMEDLYEDRDEEIAYTESYIKNHYGLYEFGMWIIEEKETGRIIGRAGLDMLPERETPQLGFMIDAGHQGRGYAAEVCGAILRYAREALRLERLEASCDRRNKPSIRLLEKLGFEKTEEKEEILYFSVRIS